MQFRDLPSVETVMSSPTLEELAQVYSRPWLVDLVRDQLQVARDAIGKGSGAPTPEDVAVEVGRAVKNITRASPRSVINATGVVIHTNLGRAPLSQEAIDAATQAAQGYSDLEMALLPFYTQTTEIASLRTVPGFQHGLSVLTNVIASEAKQSLLTLMRLLRACGPRNDNRKALGLWSPANGEPKIRDKMGFRIRRQAP